MSVESFEDFRRSFSYGSRSDLNFKFLKSLSDDEAADFIAGLFGIIGDSYDHGRLGDIVDHVIDWQARAYAPEPGSDRPWSYEDGPFTDPAKPLADSRVALLTSSGHFTEDPEPFGVAGMSQQEAEERISEFLREKPELSAVPVTAAASDLDVRHGGYDVASAAIDHNVAFPIDILRDLADEGVIGELQQTAYSFVGAAAQKRLINESGPQWAGMLEAAGVDVVLLVPV